MDVHFNQVTERHIVPPKATQALVEAHGLLDTALDEGGRTQEAYNVCRKQDGGIKDRAVVNASTGGLCLCRITMVTIPSPARRSTSPMASDCDGGWGARVMP